MVGFIQTKIKMANSYNKSEIPAELLEFFEPVENGLESTPAEYVQKMVELFREVRRVLKDDGTLWLNLGDSYAGSGKGGNPEDGKQATNKGSQSIGTLYGKIGESARQSAVTNVSRRFTAGHDTLKPKDLCGIPWRVAFALQDDGWYLRQDIIWHKPNPMPESVTDRCTKAHEYVFLLSKSARYYYDADAIREPQSTASLKRYNYGFASAEQNSNGKAGYLSTKRGTEQTTIEPNESGRNKRSVWTVNPKPYKAAHFATFPPELITPMILAGCRQGGIVLDPFMGSGTTAFVARKNGCDYIGIELNPEYVELANERLKQKVLF